MPSNTIPIPMPELTIKSTFRRYTFNIGNYIRYYRPDNAGPGPGPGPNSGPNSSPNSGAVNPDDSEGNNIARIDYIFIYEQKVKPFNYINLSLELQFVEDHIKDFDGLL
ncbi:hypothetical protein QBC45DRAFT_437701 [Copromyces sp. CBS 386.78]|nr:hypothetical protein QBC45DRAFT_437701 [Copromyces sp. CBS 386.78]